MQKEALTKLSFNHGGCVLIMSCYLIAIVFFSFFFSFPFVGTTLSVKLGF
jgi:hypothetical protein